MTDPQKAIDAAKPKMTSMIDVVFLLLVFFIATMKFKTLDMKVEAFLPDPGLSPVITPKKPDVPIVARLKRTTAAAPRVIVNGQALGRSDDESTWVRLTAHSRVVRARHVENGGDPAHVRAEVDADSRVDTGDVIRAIDAFMAADLENVTFTGTKMAALPLDAAPSRR